MTERWVINSSPLICLAKVGYADLLLKLSDEIIVPQAVVDEIQAGKSGDPTILVLNSGKFPNINVLNLPEILSWDLG